MKQKISINSAQNSLSSSIRTKLSGWSSLEKTAYQKPVIHSAAPVIQFELIEVVEDPLYTPLTQSVPLTATDLFKNLSFDTPETAAKVVRFDIIHPDTTRQKAAMGPKNVYTKLNNTFQEKKYSFDQYVIVDQLRSYIINDQLEYDLT